jgi:hypothetical protein
MMKDMWIPALAAGIVLLAAGPAGADGIDIEAIQRAIEEAGAQWSAGPTPLTEMTPEERDRLIPERESVFGPPPLPEATFEGVYKGGSPPPPPPPTPSPDASRFSWHDYEGQDWMTEIKDQRTCGGCWAFASLAATEGCYNVAIGTPYLNIDLSEQVIISCTSGGCSGGMPEPVVQYLRHTGVPDEQCYPYLALDGDCGDKCSDWVERSYRISGWGWVSIIFGGERGVKERLVQGPLIASMTVYTDFMAYSSGVYEHVSGSEEGGHSVTLVGWDDEHDSWICKNSWGSGWGDGGYFEILRGEADIGYHLVYVEVDVSDLPGHPCLTPTRQSIDVVAGGDTVSVTIDLENCGGDHLDWTAGPSSACSSWLSVEPTSGSHAIGEGTTLSATIDPEALTTSGLVNGTVEVHGGISDARSYIEVNVTTMPPGADFEADPRTGPAPLTVQFTNTSSGTVTNSEWDFGDDDTAGGRNPEHTYEAEGVYTVTLEVSGPEGRDSVTKEDFITVLPPGADPIPEEAPEEAPDASEDPGAEEDEQTGEGATPGCGCSIIS